MNSLYGRSYSKDMATSEFDCLEYFPLTGRFKWKESRGRVKAGANAGCFSSHGYIQIKLKSKCFFAHQIAWFIANKVWPIGVIDHINGDKTDNRIVNLRDVSQRENLQNRTVAAPRNTTGLIGVLRDGNLFQARITANGVRHYLGHYKTAFDAHCAYMAAKRHLHTGFVEVSA